MGKVRIKVDLNSNCVEVEGEEEAAVKYLNEYINLVQQKKYANSQEPNTRDVADSRKDPAEEMVSFEITPVLEGYPNFHKLKSKSDKILWILNYALTNGEAALSPTQVSNISDELKSLIAVKDFSAHNKRNSLKGFVVKTKNENKYKIQQIGIDYLLTLN